MAEFKYLVHFENESGDRFFANADSTDPVIGGQIAAYRSFDDLREGKDAVNTAIAKVVKTASLRMPTYCVIYTDNNIQLLPPLPAQGLPIYCVGLNYKSHAKEANVRGFVSLTTWVKSHNQFSLRCQPIRRYGRSPPLRWRAQMRKSL